MLSSAFDIASQGIPILETKIGGSTIGDWFDPSMETDLGQRVDAEKKLFEDAEGRKPNILEEYDIMAKVQDAKYPFLQERWETELPFTDMKLGMSKRMGIELPAEALIAGAETVGLGGMGMLGKTAQYGARAAATGAKTKAALHATGEALRVLPRIDNFVGSVVGGAIKYTLWVPPKYAIVKPALAGAKLTRTSLDRMLNWMRRRGVQQMGAENKQAVDAAVREVGQQLVNQGAVEGVPFGTQLPMNFDTTVNGINIDKRQIQIGITSTTRAGKDQRTTPFFTEESREARREAEDLMWGSTTAAAARRGEQIYRDLVEEGRAYTEQKLKSAGFEDVSVEPNFGRFGENSEPSLFITARVTPDMEDDFLRNVAEIADVDV